jgi:hypothetical protein
MTTVTGKTPYFNDPEIYPGGATIQQRFSRYFSGHELNALETQRLSEDPTRRGISRRPDTEDLNGNGTLDTENSYYEYRLPLSREQLNHMAATERAAGRLRGRANRREPGLVSRPHPRPELHRSNRQHPGFLADPRDPDVDDRARLTDDDAVRAARARRKPVAEVGAGPERPRLQPHYAH